MSGWNMPKIDVVAGTGTGTPNDFSIADSPGVRLGGRRARRRPRTVVHSLAGGNAESVALTASGLPTGATATFSPASVTAGGSSTLTDRDRGEHTGGDVPDHGHGHRALGDAHRELLADRHILGRRRHLHPGTAARESGLRVRRHLLDPDIHAGVHPITKATSAEPAHAGSWIAWFNGNGSKDTDTAAQSVAIPAGCTASLSYWLHIDTTESTTTAKPDTFTVQILNSSGTVLATVGSFSNLDKASGYTQQTADLSAYAGQTVTVKFTGTEADTSGGTTTFVVDDTALQTH